MDNAMSRPTLTIACEALRINERDAALIFIPGHCRAYMPVLCIIVATHATAQDVATAPATGPATSKTAFPVRLSPQVRKLIEESEDIDHVDIMRLIGSTATIPTRASPGQYPDIELIWLLTVARRLTTCHDNDIRIACQHYCIHHETEYELENYDAELFTSRVVVLFRAMFDLSSPKVAMQSTHRMHGWGWHFVGNTNDSNAARLLAPFAWQTDGPIISFGLGIAGTRFYQAAAEFDHLRKYYPYRMDFIKQIDLVRQRAGLPRPSTPAPRVMPSATQPEWEGR